MATFSVEWIPDFVKRNEGILLVVGIFLVVYIFNFIKQRTEKNKSQETKLPEIKLTKRVITKDDSLKDVITRERDKVFSQGQATKKEYDKKLKEVTRLDKQLNKLSIQLEKLEEMMKVAK